jgi:hypothetical protein
MPDTTPNRSLFAAGITFWIGPAIAPAAGQLS